MVSCLTVHQVTYLINLVPHITKQLLDITVVLVKIELLVIKDHLRNLGANHAAASCVRKVCVVEMTYENLWLCL